LCQRSMSRRLLFPYPSANRSGRLACPGFFTAASQTTYAPRSRPVGLASEAALQETGWHLVLSLFCCGRCYRSRRKPHRS